MITQTKSFKSNSDDSIHPTLEAAQTHELSLIFGGSNCAGGPYDSAKVVMENKDKILDILTTTIKSRPRARKANGATRKPRISQAEPTRDIL